MIYAVWMLHIVDFSDEWWGLLAIGPGHYHGMKLSTSEMSVFGPSPCIQIMVGNLPTTPLASGTVFRKTTWASWDQEGFSLAATGAQTQWPPKILLGYFDYKFLPLEEFTIIGDLCN